MTGSKRRKDRRARKFTRIIAFIAVGLAIGGIIYVLSLAQCI